MDLMVIRGRAALVQARTSLVNTARGLVKAIGERLPKVDAEALDLGKASGLPDALQEVLRPLLVTIEELTQKIKAADKEIERMARTRYPETELLMQVSGVGPLIALTFVLTVDDKERFAKSRCRLFHRTETTTPGFGRAAAAVTNHQRGRYVFARASGAGGTLHSQPAGPGFGSEALGRTYVHGR